MGYLFEKVGSFAGDYSGAASVLQEMEGMVIFCDASACFGGYVFGEDPKGGNEERRIYTASLREKQVVMGIDKKVKKDALRTYRDVGGEFVALIGTPVSAVIGADLNGIGKEICKDIQKEGLSEGLLPSFGVPTNGWGFYDDGQEKAYLALVNAIVEPNAENVCDVNVIGATSIDMWDYNQIEDCLTLLKEAGAKAPIVWGANGGIKEMKGAAGAKLNIAVSVSAVKAVKELHRRYGTPYLIGYPLGKTQTKLWKSRVSEMLNGEKSHSNIAWEIDSINEENKEGKRALIIAEQFTANAIRTLLREKFGYSQIDVASFFQMNKKLKQENDFRIKEEAMLSEFMRKQAKYDLVIADPFCFQILAYQPEKKLALPHIAVSSLLYLGQSANIFGEKAEKYFAMQEV